MGLITQIMPMIVKFTLLTQLELVLKSGKLNLEVFLITFLSPMILLKQELLLKRLLLFVTTKRNNKNKLTNKKEKKEKKKWLFFFKFSFKASHFFFSFFSFLFVSLFLLFLFVVTKSNNLFSSSSCFSRIIGDNNVIKNTSRFNLPDFNTNSSCVKSVNFTIIGIIWVINHRVNPWTFVIWVRDHWSAPF